MGSDWKPRVETVVSGKHTVSLDSYSDIQTLLVKITLAFSSW